MVFSAAYIDAVTCEDVPVDCPPRPRRRRIISRRRLALVVQHGGKKRNVQLPVRGAQGVLQRITSSWVRTAMPSKVVQRCGAASGAATTVVRCPASSNAATACRAKFVSPISKNDFDSPMGVRVRADCRALTLCVGSTFRRRGGPTSGWSTAARRQPWAARGMAASWSKEFLSMAVSDLWAA
jgi:hypothetical protein